MLASRKLLAQLGAEGLLSVRAEQFYELEFHYDSMDDWLDFVNRPRAGAIQVDESLLSSALERSGVVVVREQDVATSYKLHGSLVLQGNFQ